MDQYRYFPGMQNLVDEFEEHGIPVKYYAGASREKFRRTRFYTGQKVLKENYVYLADSQEEFFVSENSNCGAFVIRGTCPEILKNRKFSVLEVNTDKELDEIEEICENVFDQCEKWNDELCDIMIRSGNIQKLCEASLQYFHNPLFVHDDQFFEIACPDLRPEMIQWTKDKYTGNNITPMNTINEFRTSQEYRHTMETRGAQIFSDQLRGYRDIYVNLWNTSGRYMGRLVICELDTAIKPGQLKAAEYLAEFIVRAMNYKPQNNSTYDQIMVNLLEDLVNKKIHSQEEISERIALMGWTLTDAYVVACLSLEERVDTLHTSVSLCNEIESNIHGSKAFVHQGHIGILINLKINQNYTSELGVVVREGLFKAGISNVMNHLMELPTYYFQAVIALGHCRKSGGMRWSYHFDEAALDFILASYQSEMPVVYACSDRLRTLIQYDKENGTEYFHTLRVYIEQEQKAVEAAKQLYIGRSTLFYRLKNIMKLTALDHDKIRDPQMNLFLRLSFYILEREEKFT